MTIQNFKIFNLKNNLAQKLNYQLQNLKKMLKIIKKHYSSNITN